MNPEQVAKQLADSRPGFRLVDYGEVGLPYWRISLSVTVQERKQIDPIREFVLRATTLGIEQQEDLTQLLGLDPLLLRATISRLVMGGLVKLADNEAITLTAAGESALAELNELSIQESVIPVLFDGLLRTPVGFIGDWMTPRDLKQSGIREIPPAPAKRPDEAILRSFLPELQSLLDESSRNKAAEAHSADLLAIRSVNRFDRVYRHAVLLLFRGSKRSQTEVGFAINGVLSTAHEEAFAKADLMKKFGINAGRVQRVPDRARAELSEDLRNQIRVARRDSNELQKTNDAPASNSTEVPIPQTSEPNSIKPSVIALEVFDHPGYLDDALENSKERLLIISPWIRDGVVNPKFLKRLEATLHTGVRVHIGWGFSKGKPSGSKPDASPRAESNLRRLEAEYHNFTFRHFGNTHAKVLISDRRFVITGSFNWLSFRGDPKQTYREEEGTLVSEPEHIDAQYEKFLQRFAN